MKYLSILQRTLGAVFVLSALLKMVSFAAFVQETGTFMDAYFWETSREMLTAIAAGVCATELVLGVLTFFRRTAFGACLGLLALLTFFVWLTVKNVFFPTLMGSVESCGCFGELIHFSPVASLVKSVVLWVAALGVCAWSQADRRQRRKEARRE